MHNYLLKNWKKLASATSRDSLELEEAFMEQAQNFVQNKARPIFKEPYLLGFEIVHRPDESNTRMVGMYAFRITNELFYVPVIFINGDIKGVESIYSESEKLFYPLNAGWCDYLLSKHEEEEGRSIDKQEALKKQVGINPDEVLNYKKHKNASVFKEIIETIGSALKNDTSELMLKAASEFGPDLINNIIDMAEDNDAFAEAMASLTDFSKIEKAVYDYKEPNVVKKASTNDLTLRLGRFCKSANTNNLLKGFSIEDNRPFEKLASVTLSPDKSFRRLNTEDCVVDILCEDKTIKTCLVLRKSLYISGDTIGGISYYGESGTLRGTNWGLYGGQTKGEAYSKSVGDNSTEIWMLSLEDEKMLQFIENPTVIDEIVDNKVSDNYLKEKPVTGKRAIAVLPNGNYVKLGKIIKVTTKENITAIVYKLYTEACEESKITVNWDKDCTEVSRHEEICYFGSDVRFFVYKNPDEDEYGSYTSIASLGVRPVDLFDRHLHEYVTQDKKFDVLFDKNASLFNILCDNTETGWCKRAYATCQMVGKMNITESVADELINEAMEVNHLRGYIEKSSSQISMDQPVFNSPHYSQYLDSMVDPGTDEEITGRSQFAPDEEVEDIVDKNKAVRSGTPQEIFEISIQLGSQQMFDAGAITGLAKTYDANFYVDQFTPDLLQAMDKLARLIFLFYWKPEDMKSAFGTDDMSQLESTLISTYKNYGDLVLELIQKNRVDKKM